MSEFIATCPFCKNIYSSQTEWVGQMTLCPSCHQKIVIAIPRATPIPQAAPIPQSEQPQQPEPSPAAAAAANPGFQSSQPSPAEEPPDQLVSQEQETEPPDQPVSQEQETEPTTQPVYQEQQPGQPPPGKRTFRIKGVVPNTNHSIPGGKRPIRLQPQHTAFSPKEPASYYEKGAWDYFVECITKKYADFSGRACRKEYWSFSLIYFLIMALLIVLYVLAIYISLTNFGEDVMIWVMIGGSVILQMLGWAVFAPQWAVYFRRLHDTGRGVGTFLVTLLVPIVGQFMALVLMCLDSDPGPNQYGPNPKAPR